MCFLLSTVIHSCASCCQQFFQLMDDTVKKGKRFEQKRFEPSPIYYVRELVVRVRVDYKRAASCSYGQSLCSVNFFNKPPGYASAEEFGIQGAMSST